MFKTRVSEVSCDDRDLRAQGPCTATSSTGASRARTWCTRAAASCGRCLPLSWQQLSPRFSPPQGYNTWLRNHGEHALTAFGTAFMWAGALHAAYAVAVPVPLRPVVAHRNARLAMVSGSGAASSRCPSPPVCIVTSAGWFGLVLLGFPRFAVGTLTNMHPSRAACLASGAAGGRVLRPDAEHPAGPGAD